MRDVDERLAACHHAGKAPTETEINARILAQGAESTQRDRARLRAAERPAGPTAATFGRVIFASSVRN